LSVSHAKGSVSSAPIRSHHTKNSCKHSLFFNSCEFQLIFGISEKRPAPEKNFTRVENHFLEDCPIVGRPLSKNLLAGGKNRQRASENHPPLAVAK